MLENRRELFNPVLLWGMTFFAVSGIISGVFSAKCNTEAYDIIKEASLFSDNFTETVKSGFFTELVWVVFSALGGINVFLVPLAFIATFIKGYTYGFTSGCIMASLGFYGYGITLSGLLAHNFLSLLLLVFYGTYGVNKSIGCHLNRRNYDYIQRENRKYIRITLVTIVLLTVISVIEAAISGALYEI